MAAQNTDQDQKRLYLLIALFYLGWFKFLAPGTQIYLIDYAQRALIIYLGFAALRGACTPLIKPIPLPVLVVAVVGPAAIIWGDTLTKDLPLREAIDTAFFNDVSFPPIDNKTWEIFDLAFGLLLVAVSEELVFRKLWTDWSEARGQSEFSLYLWSSLVFGALHLPQGLADTAIACVWGMLIMYLYRRSASLPLVILVHYLVDIWYFT